MTLGSCLALLLTAAPLPWLQTSFIKALAHYNNRHVVNIPLGKIRTNQELMVSPA